MGKQKSVEKLNAIAKHAGRVGFKYFKKCWIPLAVLFLFMAIVFSLFRALTPWANKYKGQVEQHLSTLLGQPVTIQDLQTTWYWFHPVLKMDAVTVSDKHDHALKLNKLLVGINVLSSLWHWQIQPGILYVEDVHLVLRQKHDHWEIDGLSQAKQAMQLDESSYSTILIWLLSQENIVLKKVSVLICFNDGSRLPVDDLNFTVDRAYGHYKVKGHAILQQKTPTSLTIIADLHIDAAAPTAISGHAYMGFHDAILSQWQRFLPDSNYHVLTGKGNVDAWLDLKAGKFSALQSKLTLHDLEWAQNGKSKHQYVSHFDANLAWKPRRSGWRLSSDQIQLTMNGIAWPKNTLQIDYNKVQQSYRLFIKTLLLEPALAMEVNWPEFIEPILAMKLKGQLDDAQLEVKNGQVDYLLSKFINLSWHARNDIPAVSQISGVVFWQPNEGRLELDGEHTVIKPLKLPAVQFDLLNAAFEWKALNNVFRIGMDRLVLSHPDLVISARGVLDDPLSPEASNLRLTTEFSLKKGEQWIPYIPAQYLKPKLNKWLKEDVKHIAKASGQLVVDGSLANFPYDTQPGQFSITSHLSGVDLLITDHWPINRDIDADLLVNKRLLEANIFNANLSNMPVDRLNLVINDIGLGKEALLIHGNLDAPAADIKNYIYASPLKDRLLKWQRMEIQHNLSLDLQLEIPLYPESDHVLAQGVLSFDKNPVVFHYTPKPVQVNDVTGMLQFNEYGLTEGGLNGNMDGDPVVLISQYEAVPTPHTNISIESVASMALLRNTFGLPLLTMMEGRFNVKGLIALNNDPNVPDVVHLASGLEGLAIDLPPPFGKSLAEKLPLNVDLTSFKEKSNLQIHYQNRLSADLWFKSADAKFILKNGEIRLGEGQAKSQKSSQVAIVGSLPIVDMLSWHEVVAKIPAQTKTLPGFDAIRDVDVKINNFIIFDQIYNDFAVKARKSKDDWAVQLQQKTVSAHLLYKPTENAWFGNFEKLTITPPSERQKKSHSDQTALSPNDIPNINITIDQFNWGKVDIGSVTLTSSSTPSQWTLESCQIKSPDYQLSLKGNWVQQQRTDNTTVQADLKIHDLAKSLERWKITPAVQAHQGDVQFKGSWPYSLRNFSLAHTSGDVHITLKDGRITHLDSETEEKLGLGRLLSILSLQTIPRRLKLDFSDLSEQGYSFDIFSGSFQLKNGVMTTEDSYIDGPVAYASMKGDLDLAKQMYDVDLRVSPYITASLPVVATIAGGPIAGIATWVASNIINKSMQKISAYTYKISGPWSTPVVQQISIVRKK